MDAEPKYITESGFDIDEGFVETLQAMDIRTGIKLAKFIQDNIGEINPNLLVSTILGCVVMNDNNEPMTFAVEVIKDYSDRVILSDLQFICMDEYLDLLNLKSNENRQNNRIKKNNRGCL